MTDELKKLNAEIDINISRFADVCAAASGIKDRNGNILGKTMVPMTDRDEAYFLCKNAVEVLNSIMRDIEKSYNDYEAEHHFYYNGEPKQTPKN